MPKLSPSDRTILADAYAFLGNSLLRPMSMTSDIGLDPLFWREFPDFGDAGVRRAKENLIDWAAANDDDPERIIEETSYQYTKLFIGPPSPAAAPWETMYRGEEGTEVTVAFGTPTFQMRQRLRDIGLELSNENNQYEDHIGIELLYLSELCRRLAQGDDGTAAAPEADVSAVPPVDAAAIAAFIEEHPLGWIDQLASKAANAFPNGYIPLLLELAKALLVWQARP